MGRLLAGESIPTVQNCLSRPLMYFPVRGGAQTLGRKKSLFSSVLSFLFLALPSFPSAPDVCGGMHVAVDMVGIRF